MAPGMSYSDLSLYCRQGLCGRRVQVQIRRPLIGGYNHQERFVNADEHGSIWHEPYYHKQSMGTCIGEFPVYCRLLAPKH